MPLSKLWQVFVSFVVIVLIAEDVLTEEDSSVLIKPSLRQLSWSCSLCFVLISEWGASSSHHGAGHLPSLSCSPILRPSVLV